MEGQACQINLLNRAVMDLCLILQGLATSFKQDSESTSKCEWDVGQTQILYHARIVGISGEIGVMNTTII